MPIKRKRLGEILIDRKKINEEQLREALSYQKEYGGRLGAILVYLGFCSSSDVVEAIIEQIQNSNIKSLVNYFIDTSVILLLDYDFCKEHHLIPIELDGDILLIASVESLDDKIKEDIFKKTGYKVANILFDINIINEAIEEYYRPYKVKRSSSFLDSSIFRFIVIGIIIIIILLLTICQGKSAYYRLKEILNTTIEVKNKGKPVEITPVIDDHLTSLLNEQSRTEKGSDEDFIVIEGGEYRSKEEIKRVLLFNYDELIRYYNSKLRRYPDLRGNVVFEITILPSGIVSNVKIVSSEIKNKDFLEGVRKIIKKWRFSKIEYGTVKIKFPFNFKF